MNPSTLVFAYTPVEDPAVCAKAWEGFIKYMARCAATSWRGRAGAWE